MNDYTDLTDLLTEVVNDYVAELRTTGDPIVLLDLDFWETDDLLIGEQIFKQALDLRLDDTELERLRNLAAQEMDEMELSTYEEYLEVGIEPADATEQQADLEADYENPLFVG